jgi:beta-N-acetylhexosaminidase
MPVRLCFVIVMLMAISMPLRAASGKPAAKNPGPIHLDRDGEKWADKTLHKMTTEEKVGQLFMVWVRAQFLNDENPDYLQLRDEIRKYHVGGFAMTVPVESGFLVKSEPSEAAMLLNRLQSDSPLPLLIAADFERGLTMRLHGPTPFPHAMAFGGAGKLDDAEAFGRITAEESRAIGVHWNFFPDADVNSNPANPIINTRSFGEDPQQVGDLVAAYIRGAHQGGMLVTAKHFPGHGDTDTDSHLGVARVNSDLDHLKKVELPPFEKAIDSGVDAIMVAHVSVPALEPDPNRVATISPRVVTDLLKKQMKFQGIVVSDALDMAGLTRLYEHNIGRAAVEAFKAGNDVLLIPADLDASYRAMVEAVKSGEISHARLDDSVRKILRTKASLGLAKSRKVEVSVVADRVGKPQNVTFGQQIADDAVTLVKDNNNTLPLKSVGTRKEGLPYLSIEETHNHFVVVVFSEDVRNDSGRALARQVRARVPDANVLYVDTRVAAGMSDEILKAVGEAETVVAAVYLIPSPGVVNKTAGAAKNSVSMGDATATLLNQILGRATKTIVVAMGNPYVASSFPQIQTYLCTFSNVSISEVSAVKALFGEIPVRGHLPVSIPDVAQRGAGLERPAKQASSGGLHVFSTIGQ